MRPKAAFMFELQNGIILVLYSRIALAKNIKQLVAPPSLTEFSIGPLYNINRESMRCSNKQRPLVLL